MFMKINHQPVIYVLFPDEGHAFVKTENDLAFYAIMEAFLAKELGGRFQKIGDDVENSSAIILEGKELIEGVPCILADILSRSCRNSWRLKCTAILNRKNKTR